VTVEVQEVQEVQTRWYRDHRPWTRTMANVSSDLGTVRNHAVAVGIPATASPLPHPWGRALSRGVKGSARW
jgi:hypothetical protein